MPGAHREPVDTGTISPSLIIRPVDTVTGDRPRGRVSLRLRNRPERVVETPSGHFVATGIDPSESPVSIETATNDWYLDETMEVAILDPSDEIEAVDIPLLPSRAYPFDTDTTLVRGTTTIAATVDPSNPDLTPGEAIGEVSLRVVEEIDDSDKDDVVLAQGRSDRDGEFALPFVKVKDYLVERSDGSYIEVDGGDPKIEATHKGENLETSLNLPVKAQSSSYVSLTLAE